jgi:hypothetical protein
MRGNLFFRILAALILLAAIAGVAALAYQAGAAHAALTPAQASTGQVGGRLQAVPVLFFFPGAGLFGLLALVLLLVLAFSSLRRLLWGPRWERMPRGAGRFGRGSWDEGVPPMFAEWHRRAHAAQGGNGPDQEPAKQ